MEFKIGDRVEALEDGFIEKDNCNNVKVDILLYKKGTKGTILNVWKNDLLVKFDSGYDDCKWSIPKKHCKLINKKIDLKEKWNKFVKENILINCETKEDFKNFINFARKNFDLNYLIYKDCFEEVGNELCFNFEKNDLYYGKRKYYVDEKEYNDFKILTWSEFMKDCKANNMEKTFEEVLKDIKNKEVWSDGILNIQKIDDKKIDISYVKSVEVNFMVIDLKSKFILKRKEYDYIEAYTAYLKENKEIESIYSGINYKRKDEKDYFLEDYEDGWHECSGMEFNEINGKWYIND